MRAIKITSESFSDLLPLSFDKSITLPRNYEGLHSFILDEISDNVIYYIEASPDSDNPINYDGVTIALRLYFKHIREEFLKLKIVIIGFEDKASFFQNCDYGMVLKCPSIEYFQLGLKSTLQIPASLSDISPPLAIDSIRNIGIKPHTSHKTHHSIVNEWSIYRWSKYLGFDSPIDSEVKNSFYFNYLKTIYKIREVDEKQNFLVESGRLLIIDDEISKGWGSFFDNLKLRDSKLKIKTIGEDFKTIEDRAGLVEIVSKEIQKYKPDTIILDLRLHDSDFNDVDSQELTGFKILEHIKNEINNGIQVIIFSASNNIANFQSLNTIGFDGWITKESPELSKNENSTKDLIHELKSQITYCLKRRYLRDISEETRELNCHIDKLSSDSELKETLKNQLDLAYYLLSKAEKREQFAYAYVSLYMIIETVNNYFVSQSKDNKYWCLSGVNLKNWTYLNGRYIEYSVDENRETGESTRVEFVIGNKPPEWKKLAGLYFQIWKGQDHKFVQEVYHLITKRNGFIHNDKEILDKTRKNKSGEDILDGNSTYMNHDIYEPQGYVRLFDVIKKILNYI